MIILFLIGSWTSCREAKQAGQRRNAAKRFDITSLPASHPPAVSVKKRPKLSKDKNKHKYSKQKKIEKDSSKEGPKIDLELKLNDETKPKEQEPEEVVVGQPIHHRPWVPYMHRPLYPFQHRPLYPFHMRHHPHHFSHYMPYDMRFSHPSYWRFQGYFPHFMRRRAPWFMNPSDIKNIHRYPEYQYGDVQFTQSDRPFRSRQPSRDFNDLSSDIELLDKPERLHDDLTHSKNKIKSHKEYNRLHEQDRKTVDDSEDSKVKSLRPGTFRQKEAERVQGPKPGEIVDQQVLNFNPTQREDEETNYPEYKSEFNTDRFWSSGEKSRGKVNSQFSSHEPEKEENAIFRDFTSDDHGFDLDDISSSHTKRKEPTMERGNANKVHKVRSGAGGVKIKLNSPDISNAVKSFA